MQSKFSSLRLASAFMEEDGQYFLVGKKIALHMFSGHILIQNACIFISMSCASVHCVLAGNSRSRIFPGAMCVMSFSYQP